MGQPALSDHYLADAWLANDIYDIHVATRCTYGAPRLEGQLVTMDISPSAGRGDVQPTLPSEQPDSHQPVSKIARVNSNCRMTPQPHSDNSSRAIHENSARTATPHSR